ncbi:hypothetical protein [Archaeoglobus neptunius]|uniref:hypothetical protein n=1 Tax=Archaeoglobus neptunius TaxID=2798580 RepID=UPI0019293EF5|nr:hypothetical protein [Archaeoglobus neptunius]
MEQDRINGIIIHSGEWDRIYHGFSIASVLASMGEETQVFLSYWALKNLCRGYEVFESEEAEREIREGMKKGIVKRIEQVVNVGKAFGTLRVIACSGSMALFNIREDELPSWVDKVGGLTEVLGADNVIFI